MESDFTHSPAFFFLSAERYLSVLKPRCLRWELHPAAITLMAFLAAMLALICTIPAGVLLVTDPTLLLLLRRISITFSYPVNLGLVMRVLACIIVRLLRENVHHDLFQ